MMAKVESTQLIVAPVLYPTLSKYRPALARAPAMPRSINPTMGMQCNAMRNAGSKDSPGQAAS